MQDTCNSLPGKITLPSSFTTPLPGGSRSTTRVKKALSFLQQYKDGRQILTSPWYTYKLKREEFNELISLVKKEESLLTFVKTKLRYGYNSLAETLNLQMPARTHEVFLAKVTSEIERRVHAFADIDSQSKVFARRIEFHGSSRLDLQSDGDNQAIIRRDPDAMFQRVDARWPAVIVEVVYSQKTRDPPHLADDYILRTNGNIRAVVGLDIDYKTTKGTISMWRPGYVKNKQGQLELEATQTLSNQVFRDESGGPNLSRDAGLRLKLKDFATDNLAKGISESFLIPSVELCRFLNDAERAEEKYKQERGDEMPLHPGARKRRRHETPPEEASSDDDNIFADNKRRARIRESEESFQA